MAIPSILMAVLLRMLVAQAPAAGIPGNIQGTVCEVESCKPISGARVVAAIPGLQRSRRTAITGLAGTFQFPQLPPGRYQINVEADDFSPAGILPMVTIDAGGTVQPVKIEMRALGTISGHAFDENGEPLAAARVEAAILRLRTLTPVADAETDDRGEFRLHSLDPDEYYIRITPPINRRIPNSYPTTYYPNTTDPAAAAKVVVKAGAEVSGIEPRLSSHGVSVRGRIVNPKNDPAETVLLLIPRSSSIVVPPFIGPNTADRTTDQFEIRGAAPGSYYIYAITASNSLTNFQWVRTAVEVGNKDVENITIALTPPGTIKGRLLIASDAINKDSLDISSIVLHATPAELIPRTPYNLNAQVMKTGEFEYAHMSEMILVFRDQVLADTWFISDVRFNGHDVMTTGFSAVPGTESLLEVTISNAAGSLSGVIKDRQDKPVPAGRLVLLPEPFLRVNPFLIKTGVAIERGEFTMDIIPPGEYTVIALPDEDQFTPAFLRDVPSIEKYERYGEHVHIGAGETTRLAMIVAPVEPN